MNEHIVLVGIKMDYLTSHLRFIMSTPSESSPLIKPSPRQKMLSCCSHHFQYRLPRIEEKGAIIVVVCNLLIHISLLAQLQRNYYMSSTLSIPIPLISIVVFPIAGIVADTCVGRFRVIQASIVLLTTSSLLTLLSLVAQHYLELTTTTKTAFSLINEGLCCVGGSCYIACIFPFTGDQLIGASGEQLSFAMYWMMWGINIAINTTLLSYIPDCCSDFIAIALALSCVSITTFILCYWKDSVNTVHTLTNPYKLIFSVLYYSWKHKYPERRSALTYWEEDVPSRIDLGMSKYGGPFTFEEVEDVKTILRLLPVVICAGGCCVGAYVNWENLLIIEVPTEKFQTILAYSDMLYLMMVALGIPLYHFLIYPIFYNFIPTMLKRIGFGLLLLLCSFLASTILGNILLCSSQTNVTCLFFHSGAFNISSDGLWWILFPETATSLGVLFSVITLFEFVFAQTPHSIRGLMTGLIVLSFGLSSSVGFGVCKLAYAILSQEGMWFIIHISLTIISAVYLVLFVCFSKRYKLRKRDDIVPIHLFAEEYFEKELEGRRRQLVYEELQWRINS